MKKSIKRTCGVYDDDDGGDACDGDVSGGDDDDVVECLLYVAVSYSAVHNHPS